MIHVGSSLKPNVIHGTDQKYGEKTINLFLTEREGRTGEYWPKVVAVRTERSEVRTKMT